MDSDVQTINYKKGKPLTQRLFRTKNFYKEDRNLDHYLDQTRLLNNGEKRTLKKLLKLRQRENGNLEAGLQNAEMLHKQWLSLFVSEDSYVQAHGSLGTELSTTYNLKRSLVSFTTDPIVAARFAQPDGVTYVGQLSDSFIPQTLSGGREGEFLGGFGVSGSTPLAQEPGSFGNGFGFLGMAHSLSTPLGKNNNISDL